MRLLLAHGTYALVSLTLVFFRASTMRDAGHISRAMIAGGADRHLMFRPDRASVLLVTVLLVGGHWMLRDTTIEDTWRRLPMWVRPLILASMILTICLVTGDERAFIYFQF